MGTSKRDLIKRKHTAIANSLTRALEWTAGLAEQFEKHHPDYAEGYRSIYVIINMAYENIIKMRDRI